MSQRLYVSLFVALAVCFVPVLLFLGMITKILPLIAVVAGAFHDGLFLGAVEVVVLVVHILFYAALFYAVARGSYLLISKIPGKGLRTGVQAAVLLAVFATSFIPVLEWDSYAGNSRGQTFWSALSGYFGKRS